MNRAPRIKPWAFALMFAPVLALLTPGFEACAGATADAGATAMTDRYSAASLYNLANAYARGGQPGLAVLNYERAALLAPQDPDVAANLLLVRTAARLPIDTPGRLIRWFGAIDPDWFAGLGVLGLLLAGGGLYLARGVGPRRMLGRSSLILSVLLIALPAADAVVLWPKLHAAVVLRAATPVRAAPAPMGDALFTLPEADTVGVRAAHEEFVLVRTRDGRAGWVAKADLGFVVAQP